MRQKLDRHAIFPGSFDPFTIGHLDVLESSLKLFDKVTVAVGYNHLKKGFMTPEHRTEYIMDCIAPLIRRGYDIDVVSYTGLTVNFCKSKGIKFIIRGVRTGLDYETESAIANANGRIAPDIQTIFIPAAPELSFVSSTVARDIIINGGDASLFLPSGTDISKYIPDK